MSAGLQGRRALITGGRGIGAATAIALARDGADVAVVYRRDKDAAHAVVEHIRSSGRQATAFKTAIDDPEQCDQLAATVAEEFGAIDILVNCAGIASTGRFVAETTADELDRVLRIHAFGPHFLLRALLPQLRRHPRSDVVLVSSIATDTRRAGSAPYTMGKAALEALAHVVAKEERGNGVHVNVVAPGLVNTEMGQRLIRAQVGRHLDELHAEYPFGHVCSPGEVADVIAFLVSDAAGYVNDQRIVVDGGSFNSP